MVHAGSSSKHFLPHALVATIAVIVLPAFAVSLIETSGRAWLVVLSVLLAMGLSIGAASLGCAVWIRRPGSRDLVFADLMLWGWLRRIRAERRLAEVQGLVESGAGGVEVLRQLADLLEAKDARTLGHTRRVTRHAERIALELGLPDEEVARIRVAASVHDVGKVYTPTRILVKPGALSDREFAVMKRHPVDGAEMVAALGVPEVTAMVRHHHERRDGSGYPDGLRGEEIPLGARIIAVADTFDAMTSSRAYRAACTHREALDVMAEEGGVRLDADAVAAFDRYYSGRRSVAWSALGLAGPPRLGSWVGGLLNGVGGWGTPLAQGIAGIGAVVLVGASLGSQAAPAPATPASEASSPVASRTPVPDRGAPGHSERASKSAESPARERTWQRSFRRAPGGRSPGGPAPVGDPPATGGPAPGGGPAPSGGPSTAGSGSTLPSVELPQPEAPGVELPELQTPEVELPPVELGPVELGPVGLGPVGLPGIEVPSVRLPSAEVSDTTGALPR